MPDPDPHDAQLVAVFEHRQLADTAHHALLSAGIHPSAIELVGPDQPQPDAPTASFWTALGRLFAPADEAHELGHAVDSGYVMIIVHPADAAEREVALEALEGCGPLDLDHRRADPENVPSPSAPPPTQPQPTQPQPTQPQRDQIVRIVEERMRVGWRDRPAAGRVRQYLAPKSTSADRQRVQLEEEDFPAPADPAPPPATRP